MEHEAEEGDSNKQVPINSDLSFRKTEPLKWASCSADSFSSSSSGSPTHEINLSKKSNPQPEKTSVVLERKTSLVSSKNVLRGQVVGSGKPPPPDYDPNRIPAFVFASKPVTPMDWSVASNESMFSIQTGDNSISKDFPVLMMAKSQDLGKLDEVMSKFSPTMLPSVIAAPAAYTEEETGITEKKSTDVSLEISEDQRKQSITPSIEISEDQRKKGTASNSDGFVDEGKKSNIVKAETGMKKQKSLLQFPRAFSNAAGRKWLFCFSCCSPSSCRSGYCRR